MEAGCGLRGYVSGVDAWSLGVSDTPSPRPGVCSWDSGTTSVRDPVNLIRDFDPPRPVVEVTESRRRSSVYPDSDFSPFPPLPSPSPTEGPVLPFGRQFLSGHQLATTEGLRGVTTNVESVDPGRAQGFSRSVAVRVLVRTDPSEVAVR